MAWIRDNKPINVTVLRRTLVGMSEHAWYRTLNVRLFGWRRQRRPATQGAALPRTPARRPDDRHQVAARSRRRGRGARASEHGAVPPAANYPRRHLPSESRTIRGQSACGHLLQNPSSSSTTPYAVPDIAKFVLHILGTLTVPRVRSERSPSAYDNFAVPTPLIGVSIRRSDSRACGSSPSSRRSSSPALVIYRSRATSTALSSSAATSVDSVILERGERTTPAITSLQPDLRYLRRRALPCRRWVAHRAGPRSTLTERRLSPSCASSSLHASGSPPSRVTEVCSWYLA